MSQLIIDNDFTTAQPISDIREIMPFSQYGVNTVYVYEQDFCQLKANFTPVAIDTAHPTIAGAFLAMETNPIPTSVKSVVTWTRRYASVPASFSRSGATYPYVFPVLLAGTAPNNRLAPFSFSVGSRILTEFFHTSDPTTVAVNEPQRYLLLGFPLIDATSPFGQPVVTDPSTGDAQTVPSYSTYASWVVTGTEIIPEASKLTSFWMGYIHMRETIYIKAH